MDSASFSQVAFWIFDLDNTLYTSQTGLFEQITERIRSFIRMLIPDLCPKGAAALQRQYCATYGTSLRGLMVERGINPHIYLDYVHAVDHAVLAPNPDLAEAICRLPGKRFIMTNSTRVHAESVIQHLGITECFDGIFGILESNLFPKPLPQAYQTFLKCTGVKPRYAAMFEDTLSNLSIPFELGMRTILVHSEDKTHHTLQADSTNSASSYCRVHHTIHDLTGFLNTVSASLREV